MNSNGFEKSVNKMSMLSAMSMFDDAERCSKDIVYFVTNYIEVEGVRFTPKQLRILKNWAKKPDHLNLKMLNAARQSGKTLLSVVFAYWYASFHTTGKTVVIFTDKKYKADAVQSLFCKIVQDSTYIFAPKVLSVNKAVVEFGNGGRVMFVSGTEEPMIRGVSAHVAIVDEGAFYITRDYLNTLWPSLAYNKFATLIIPTTFHKNQDRTITKIWRDAPDWQKMKLSWEDMHHNDLEDFRDSQIKLIGGSNFAWEFGCRCPYL